MKKYTVTKIAVIFLSLIFSNQSWSQITAEEAVKAIGRGINMGNTFDARNYEGEWATEAREYYFDMYVDAGFSTVRIPVTWNVRLGKETPYALDEDFMKRLDTVIGWGLDRGLYIIINAHHDEWIKNTETFDNEKPRFFALWEQLSDRYKDYPENLFFEILNEPYYSEKVNGVDVNKSLSQAQLDELNSESLKIIRDLNATRIVLYGGKGWSSSNDLKNAAIPNPDDRYLMGYYHSYDPWNFAGESQGTWGTAANIASMENQMIGVEEWSAANGIPVLIGEFGAMFDCDYNSRMLYYANYTELALKHNLPFTVWDDDGWFQILQRKDTTWNEIKDILIYTSDSSPTKLSSKIVDDTVIQLSWISRSDSKRRIFIERRTLKTEFIELAEVGSVSTTTTTTSYNDTDVEVGQTYFYRVVEEYDAVSIPSYPRSVYLDYTSLNETVGGILEVYPNPASNMLNVGNSDEIIHSISLYSSTGQLVWIENMEAKNASISIADLRAGLYIVVAKTSNKLYKASFVKN